MPELSKIIEEWKGLEEKATKGTWRATKARTLIHIGNGTSPVLSISVSPPRIPEKDMRERIVSEAHGNAALIVALRNHLRLLLTSLSELEALRKALKALQSEADYHRAQIKHNPDEPKWKGRDVAEHLAAKSEAALAALTTSERGEG